MNDFCFNWVFASLFALALVPLPARSAIGASFEQPLREAIGKGEGRQALSSVEARAIDAERNGKLPQASKLYGQASKLARITGQLQKAISYGTKALELAEKAKQPVLQGHAIIQLVNVYRQLKQGGNSLELLLKGIELIDPSRQNLRAILYREVGVEYRQAGENQKAIKYLLDALKAFEQLLPSAQGRRRKDVKVIQFRADQVVQTLSHLARIYQETGDNEEAKSASERALDIVKQNQLKTGREDELYYGLGNLYFEQKDFSRAEDNLKRALEMAEKIQHAKLIWRASTQMGTLLRQTRAPSEAITYYRKAIEAIESTRSTLESEESRTSFFDGKGKAYTGIIQAYVADKNFEQAFNYSERARSRAFLDILGSVQLAHGELFEEERVLQARLAGLAAKMASAEEEVEDEEEVPDQTSLRRELEAAQKAYNDFLVKVRKENKEQASLMNVEPLTSKQVQDRLDPGVTMLEYFVSGSNVWLWVVEKDRVEFVSSSIRRKDLISKITGLRDTIYQFDEKERFNALSQELHKLLIQPALPHIRGKELIIIPHDVLHYLPFQALLAPNGKYLIEEYPISYLSSASLMQFTKEKRRAMGEKVLALGNPDLGDPAMNLRFATLEAKEIQKLYPQATVLLEKEATEEKAKQLSPNDDIVHFATHAELKEDDPLSSAILLAKSDKEDGRLEVREIFGMDLKASLVVLSACETGLGKISSGDELVGLTRAFIYAGTPSVVASLWNVEDSSTAALMASFYKNLKTMTKVEALRQAQLQLIRGDGSGVVVASRGIGGVGKLGETPSAMLPAPSSKLPAPISVSTSHPYFWAPFILVGDGK